MEKKSLKISLLGRTFPVVVAEEEAAAVLGATKLIQDKINQFRLEYGMRDDTDIVLMTCLFVATEYQKLRANTSEQPDTESLTEKLALLDQKLDIQRYLA